MKIILSRKGFDSANGGCPSPVMPDGTLLSMPIPSDDAASYSELQYNGMTYAELLHQLTPGKERNHCHVDPDIRDDARGDPIEDWKPAFGQVNAAGGEFTANIDACGGEGTAEFAGRAIAVYCGKQSG